MKTVVIFESDVFERPWPANPKDDPNQLTWGEDIALLLTAKLREKGVTCATPDAVEGEGGWTIYPIVGGHEFLLFIHWAPLGRPPKDYWVIQIDKRKGYLEALFSRKPPEADEQISSLVNDILHAQQGIESVRWLSMEEFRQLY